MKKKYFSLSIIAIILSIFFTQILFSAPLNVVKSVKFYKFGKSEKITFLLNNKFPKFRYYLEKSKKSFVLNLERSKLKRNIFENDFEKCGMRASTLNSIIFDWSPSDLI